MSNHSVPAAAEGMSELTKALGGLHLAACQARTFAEMAQHAGKQLTNVREDEAGRYYRLSQDDANELAASLANAVRFATTAETFAPVIGRLAHEAAEAGPSMPVSAAEASAEILHSTADKLPDYPFGRTPAARPHRVMLHAPTEGREDGLLNVWLALTGALSLATLIESACRASDRGDDLEVLSIATGVSLVVSALEDIRHRLEVAAGGDW